jgi:hypothetical protein
MAKLASLVVDLQVQSAQLRQGLDAANAKLDSFAKKAESAAKLITSAFAFSMAKQAAGALTGFIKSGADAADNMGKLAASVGTPVEELSKLAYAAEFSGSSTEEMGAALGKLSKQMGEAQSGSKEQAALFQGMGVSITDASGKMRSSGDVFRDIAQRFSEVEDGAAKTALAQELFGQSGAALIPLLNEGEAGLARFGDEAARAGRVVTEEGAAASAQFNDALKRLGDASQNLATRVAQDLAPGLAKLADSLVNSEGQTSAFDMAANALTATIRTLASAGVIVGNVFSIAGQVLAGYASALVNLLQGDLKGAKESIALLGDDLIKSQREKADLLASLWAEKGPGKALEKDAEKAKPAADKHVVAIERLKKAEKDREEAAKRAAAARKKAEEEALKAAEKAAHALDEQVKSMLALDRQNQRIDHDVAGKRAESLGSAPDVDSGILDALLGEMAAALKAEADMRAKARELESDKDFIGAHNAELAADAHRRLAERASKVADGLVDFAKESADAAKAWAEKMAEAAEQARQNMLSKLTPSSVGSMVTAVGEGAAMGGPVGAVVGGLVEMLSQSETFRAAMERVDGMFQSLSNAVGMVVEPLMPLLSVVGEMGGVLGQLVQALSPVVEFVARPLFEVFRGFGMAVVGLVQFVGELVNSIASLFGGELFDMRGINEAMERLTRASYDSARAQGQVADKAREVAEGLTNAARGFKVSLARFNATNTGPGGTPSAPGVTESAQAPVEVNVEVTLDGQDIARQMRIEARRTSHRTHGRTIDGAPQFSVP